MEWRDIPGSRGQYEISNTGIVRNKRTQRILKGFVWKSGLKGINLGGHLRKTYAVGRLVAMAFLGASEKDVVRHKGDIHDNSPENLYVEEYYD